MSCRYSIHCLACVVDEIFNLIGRHSRFTKYTAHSFWIIVRYCFAPNFPNSFNNSLVSLTQFFQTIAIVF